MFSDYLRFCYIKVGLDRGTDHRKELHIITIFYGAENIISFDPLIVSFLHYIEELIRDGIAEVWAECRTFVDCSVRNRIHPCYGAMLYQ